MSNYEQGYQDATNNQPSCPPFGGAPAIDYKDGYMRGTFDKLQQFFAELAQ
jgi:hypothetical protein